MDVSSGGSSVITLLIFILFLFATGQLPLVALPLILLFGAGLFFFFPVF
jgi:hypothetical protein